MAARHYAQIFDATLGAQSAEDDLRFASTPAPILRGKFRIGYIGRDDSSYGFSRYLISVRTAIGKELAFYLSPIGGDTEVLVYHTDDGYFFSRQPFTFSAGQELTFTFDSTTGSFEIAGATAGGGEGEGGSSGTPWSYPDGSPFRLGGSMLYPNVCARGYVSLPYAVL